MVVHGIGKIWGHFVTSYRRRRWGHLPVVSCDAVPMRADITNSRRPRNGPGGSLHRGWSRSLEGAANGSGQLRDLSAEASLDDGQVGA
jgi:hypothetical protein